MGIIIVYLILGILFTIAAGLNGQVSGWNFLTIIYTVLAIFDFIFAIEHYRRLKRLKKQHEEK